MEPATARVNRLETFEAAIFRCPWVPSRRSLGGGALDADDNVDAADGRAGGWGGQAGHADAPPGGVDQLAAVLQEEMVVGAPLGVEKGAGWIKHPLGPPASGAE